MMILHREDEDVSVENGNITRALLMSCVCSLSIASIPRILEYICFTFTAYESSCDGDL